MDWNEQLPTDSEIVWSLFCTYMDFILSPCSISNSGEPSKPFSNAFTMKGDSLIQTTNESYFIRMVLKYFLLIFYFFYYRLVLIHPFLNLFSMVDMILLQ